MTPEMERVGRILVKAEGGHWHKPIYYYHSNQDGSYWGGCETCNVDFDDEYLKDNKDEAKRHINPDFSEWQHFGRVLKIANTVASWRILKRDILMRLSIEAGYEGAILQFGFGSSLHNIDQIPALVATELARVIEEGKNAER